MNSGSSHTWYNQIKMRNNVRVVYRVLFFFLFLSGSSYCQTTYYYFLTGAPQTYTNIDQYHEGTMILDFVDARTKKLVFRGIGQAVVGGPEANAAKIREAVAKMMEGFPKRS